MWLISIRHLASSSQSQKPLEQPTAIDWDTKIRERRKKVASLTPALTVNGCGCFLPDLTRFTTLQCGETRRDESYHSTHGDQRRIPYLLFMNHMTYAKSDAFSFLKFQRNHKRSDLNSSLDI